MIKLSVIIPYFQRNAGVLQRTLRSLLASRLAPGIRVEVIVVDDGSPIPAHTETAGLPFSSPFSLTILTQPNGGVAAARNTGLNHTDDTTRYIAYLDSDDIWHEDHLTIGIQALEAGHDFYFCDNAREDGHTSYFASCSPAIMSIINAANTDDLITLPRDTLSTLILRDFVAPASCVIFRRSSASKLRFDNAMKSAGEDLIYLMQLAAAVKNPCFLPKVQMTCGKGMNMYFNSLDWNSEGHIPQVMDRLKAHRIIKDTITLSRENTRWNNAFIRTLRRDLTFHILRKIVKSGGKWPPQLKHILRDDLWFTLWFPYYAIQVTLGRVLGLYHPS